jgi:hypothetical protein
VRRLSAAIATASLIGMGVLASCDDNDKGPYTGPARSQSSSSTTVPKTVMTTSVMTNGPVG